jgi:hypothetical protein
MLNPRKSAPWVSATHRLMGLHRHVVVVARQADPDATKRLLLVGPADNGDLSRTAGLAVQPDHLAGDDHVLLRCTST